MLGLIYLRVLLRNPTKKHWKKYEMGVYPTERAIHRNGLLLGAGLYHYNRSMYIHSGKFIRFFMVA